MDNMSIVQQNMDNEICTLQSCFESYEPLCISAISLNALKRNESIHLNELLENFQTSMLNFQELLCLTVTG